MKKRGVKEGTEPVAAGDFTQWLEATEAALHSGGGGADVPCGACRGCCRSSMFIHIKPEETRTIQRIPRALLFPAPGLPKGHLLLGYRDNGECPMFLNNQCSIYEDRPQTCRDYDCRVFAATGISVDGGAQPEIAQRVREWVFEYESEESRAEQGLVMEAAAFLRDNRDLFPAGALPGYPVQLAALAVEVYKVFADCRTIAREERAVMPDAAIAQVILAAMREPETPEKRARKGKNTASKLPRKRL